VSLLFYKPSNDEKFQDIIFDDNPDGKLPWEKAYDALFRKQFGKYFSDDLTLKITPNLDNKKRRKKFRYSRYERKLNNCFI
jgi:hypothetical protein